MGKSYPSCQPSYSHEELVEHFLLTPGELERVVSAALNGFYQDVHHQIADGTPPAVRTRIDDRAAHRPRRRRSVWPPRPRRWAAAVAALIALQDEYRAWLETYRTTSKDRD